MLPECDRGRNRLGRRREQVALGAGRAAGRRRSKPRSRANAASRSLAATTRARAQDRSACRPARRPSTRCSASPLLSASTSGASGVAQLLQRARRRAATGSRAYTSARSTRAPRACSAGAISPRPPGAVTRPTSRSFTSCSAGSASRPSLSMRVRRLHLGHARRDAVPRPCPHPPRTRSGRAARGNGCNAAPRARRRGW